MRIFIKVLSNIALLYLIINLAGCGITAGSLNNHAGYADLESPYWWQAESEINLSLGPLVIGTARWAINESDDPQLDALLDDVDGVRISIYKIEDNSQIFLDDFAESQKNLIADGWQNFVRVNEDDSEDYSLMFVKSNGEVIDGLVVLSLSDDEAVFINIIGNIHPESFDTVMDNVYKKDQENTDIDNENSDINEEKLTVQTDNTVTAQ